MRSSLFIAALLPVLCSAQEKNPTASQLVATVKAAKPQGSLYARLRMENKGGGKTEILQVQLKRRQTADGTETLYQLLFPKERKGESLLLRVKGGSFSGALFTPGVGKRALKPSDRLMGVFGSALTIDDAVAEFLDWPHQKIIGKEKEGGVPCTIIESLAPKSSASPIERVKSWIDDSRLTAMKAEFFKSGDQPARTVITHKVLRGSTGYYAPVSFTVTDHTSGASTKVEGVRSDHDVNFTDTDFSNAALETIK